MEPTSAFQQLQSNGWQEFSDGTDRIWFMSRCAVWQDQGHGGRTAVLSSRTDYDLPKYELDPEYTEAERLEVEGRRKPGCRNHWGFRVPLSQLPTEIASRLDGTRDYDGIYN